MGLDIRLPIGALLAVIGVILAVFGVFSDPTLYSRSLGININLLWGAALVVVGGLMLALAGRSRRHSLSSTARR